MSNICHRPGKINHEVSAKHNLTHCHKGWELNLWLSPTSFQSYGPWLKNVSCREWVRNTLPCLISESCGTDVGKPMLCSHNSLVSLMKPSSSYTSHASLPGLSTTSDPYILPPWLLLPWKRNCHSEGLNFSIPLFHPSCSLQKHRPKGFSSSLMQLPFWSSLHLGNQSSVTSVLTLHLMLVTTILQKHWNKPLSVPS